MGITPDGAIQVSTDRGVSWQPRGNIGGAPEALHFAGSGEIYAAVDGRVVVSHDDGRNVQQLGSDMTPSRRTCIACLVHIFDPNGEQLIRFAGTLPANGIPTTLVIDRGEGRVAARVVGVISKVDPRSVDSRH